MLLVGDGQALASHQAARGQAPVGSWHGLDSIAQPSHIAMAWTIPITILAILAPLNFHIHFKITFSISTKKSAKVSFKTALNL